jgi:tRNA (guanosine-2'-O-)-methyltransferase
MEVLDEATSQRVAEVLEPFVGDERKRRVKAVLAARLESVTAVMDAPHDPHNGSAVLRTCDAFGVNALHVIQRKEDFLASRRIARGSQRWVGVHSYRTTDEAVATLRASGHSLCGTHPEGRLLPEELKQIPRLALVLGNERWGIAEELAASCEHTVRIPMRGFAESLNVSVTAAILLQHATSDRPGDLSEAEQARLYARALVLTMPRAPEILAARGVLLASPEALRAARAELGAFTRGEPE